MALSLHPIGTTIYHEQVADMEMGNEKEMSHFCSLSYIKLRNVVELKPDTIFVIFTSLVYQKSFEINLFKLKEKMVNMEKKLKFCIKTFTFSRLVSLITLYIHFGKLGQIWYTQTLNKSWRPLKPIEIGTVQWFQNRPRITMRWEALVLCLVNRKSVDLNLFEY